MTRPAPGGAHPHVADATAHASTEWMDLALDALPAAAQSVLVIAAPEDRGVAAAPPANESAESVRIERRIVGPIRRREDLRAALAVHAPCTLDAVVLGPGLLEPVVEAAAFEIQAATRVLVPGGRLVLVANDASAIPLERVLLELGYAIRRQHPIPAPGGDTSSVLVVASVDGYRMRAAREGDEPDILGLFARSFHVERSVEHWRWKYRDNPYGVGRISLAFAPGGELVGQYCAYPVRLYRRGLGSCEIQQVGDTMTAREARAVGRGPTSVLARAASHFYASFCHGRVAFNYGFNTGNIQQFGIRFLGVHRVADVPYREAEQVARPARRLLGRLLGSYTVREVTTAEGFDHRFDELFAASRDAYGALVERDRRYLAWRYGERPDLRYRTLVAERRGRMVGWGVFVRRDDTLVWGDALFRPEHRDAAAFVLEAAAEAVEGRERPRRIACWFPAYPRWWDDTLAELGFVHRPEPQELALGVAPFLDVEAPRWTGESLYYTYGDSDLF